MTTSVGGTQREHPRAGHLAIFSPVHSLGSHGIQSRIPSWVVDKGGHVVETAVGARLPASSPNLARGPAAGPSVAVRHAYVLFTDNLADLSVAEAVQAAREAGFDGLDLTLRPGGHVKPEDAGAGWRRRRRLPTRPGWRSR